MLFVVQSVGWVNLEIASRFFQLTAWDRIDQFKQNSADFEKMVLKEIAE